MIARLAHISRGRSTAILAAIVCAALLFTALSCRGGQAAGSAPAVAQPGVAPLPAPRRLWIAAVGDIMLDRSVGKRIKANGTRSILAKVAPQISAPNLTFGNLECPLSSEGPHDPMECCFRADPDTVDVLKHGGFDIVSVANNHSLNAGRTGMRNTLATLTKHGIAYTGSNPVKEQSWTPAYFTVNGLKVGFLACTDLSFEHGSDCKISRDPAAAYANVAKAKRGCDLLFVSIHWGEEYQQHRDERQRRVALALIDAGADCILGHHPHTLQGIGVYKGRPILYSMGNFVFDQKEGERMESAVFEIWWNEGTWKIKATPVWINRERMGPVYPSQDRAARIAKRLAKLSVELGAQAEISSSRVYVQIPPKTAAAKP